MYVKAYCKKSRLDQTGVLICWSVNQLVNRSVPEAFAVGIDF